MICIDERTYLKQLEIGCQRKDKRYLFLHWEEKTELYYWKERLEENSLFKPLGPDILVGWCDD